VFVYDGGSATLTACTFAGGAGSHTDSVANGGTTTFTCPKGSTGTPYVMKGEEQLDASQLPPAKEVVHCTKVPQ
jgi:hypothetical protein